MTTMGAYVLIVLWSSTSTPMVEEFWSKADCDVAAKWVKDAGYVQGLDKVAASCFPKGDLSGGSQ